MSVCAECSRRGALLAELAGSIERLDLDRWELCGLLALADDRLVEAVRARQSPPRIVRPAHPPPGAGLCRHDPRYPERLSALDSAPAALHVAGPHERPERLFEALARPVVAIVGGRKSTYYARDTASALAMDLASAGVTVIAGLAEGVETAAHEGALAAGGRTIAVMAGGADIPYPIQSDRLHARVLDQGVAVSEMPLGFRSTASWCFLARNRVIAALADTVLVVEAAERSGTLFTADVALRLGRDVGVVPGRVGDQSAQGSNRRLRDGAQVVLDARDALPLR